MFQGNNQLADQVRSDGSTDTHSADLTLSLLTFQNSLILHNYKHGKIENQTLLKGYIDRLTPRVIKSFLTFDSMDRTLKCNHSLESSRAVLYCGAVC